MRIEQLSGAELRRMIDVIDDSIGIIRMELHEGDDLEILEVCEFAENCIRDELMRRYDERRNTTSS